jgi:hypothetical protein
VKAQRSQFRVTAFHLPPDASHATLSLAGSIEGGEALGLLSRIRAQPVVTTAANSRAYAKAFMM